MADSYTAPANPAQPGSKKDPASTKMSSDDLRALVMGEYQSAASSFNASELADENARALNYYNGDMSQDMPTTDGRSSAMSMDVLETVEGLMPDLMEVFTGNEDVVEFEPTEQSDEDAAQQETDYVNHVFMQKNPGFIILYSFIKDALLSKVGVVKVFWEKETLDKRETYENLSQDVYQLLVADDEIEIVAQTKKPDPLNPANPPMYDVTVSLKKEVGSAKVVPVAQEEFGISKYARDIKSATYCFHRVKTRSAGELKAAGYDPLQIDALATDSLIENTQEIARNTVETGLWASTVNPDQRLVIITEHYVRCDYDGRGAQCIWRVVTGGNTGEVLKRDDVLDVEEVDEMPFAAMTPIIMTHRFYGKSVADLVIDIQKIKTAVYRGMLDSTYLANNPRVIVGEQGITSNTMDDLLTVRPGGQIRVKDVSQIVPFQTESTASFAIPIIEYIDQVREFRSGVSKQGQGLDPNVLQNKSATESSLQFSAAKAKSRLIARIFAETGVRDLFLLLHATIRKNDREDNTAKLRGKWVTINPRDWRERNNMTVNVGLGTGSKSEQMAMMQAIINLQSQALQAPQLGIVTPQNIYASAKRMTELAGLKSADPYWTDPSTQPPAQPQPDPAMIAANAKAQTIQMTAQAQVEATQQRAQADVITTQQKTQADIEANNQRAHAQMVADQQHADLKSQLLQQDFAEKAALRRMETVHSLIQPPNMP